jgi:hypothetical protein
VALAVAGVAWPGSTLAQTPSRDAAERRRDDDTAAREPSVALDLAAATQAPLLIGGQATLELPLRVLVQAEGGVLPRPYAEAIDAIMVGAGAYDASTSSLVRGAFSNALVARASGGWRPFPEQGLEVYAGYTLLSLGTDAGGEQLDRAGAGAVADGLGRVEVESVVHAAHGALGWRWIIADHVALRASLGYVHAVAADTAIDGSSGSSGLSPQAMAAATDLAEQRVDGLLTRHVRVPLLGLSGGYRC